METAASLLGGNGVLNESRLDQVKRGVKISIASNLLLALIKGTVGFLSGSHALVADAANSATDVISSIAVWFGVHKAHTPPDRDHPYGHGKAETIAAIIVSVFVALVGIEVGYGSIKAFFEPLDAPNAIAVVAVVISILIKEALFRYTIRLGKKMNSQAMIASAWDHRSDVFSTVAALIGILGAMAGNAFAMPWMLYLDPVAGLVVSVFVLTVAFRLGKESIDQTMDRVLDEEESKELVKTASQVEGVLKVDRLLARQHGHYMVVDIKISVNSAMTVEEGHRIGKRVKQRLLEQFPDVTDVFVHINPY